MAYPDSPTKHAAVEGRAGKIGIRAVPSERRSSRDRPKLTWGSAAVTEEGDTTIEVDEAIELDAWKLSIDRPDCYISIQIDGTEQLAQLIKFLGRADPLGPVGEFRMGRPWVTWVWDDETSGRLFVWLNRTGKHSMRAELSREQVDCIRSALAEVTKTS